MRSIGLAAVSLQGFVDAVERGIVYGWAWNPQRSEEVVEVEILLGQRVLAVVAADSYRADLVELEIGDGRHAFEYALPDELVGQLDSAEIEVRFAGSELPLPRMQVRPQRRVVPDGPPRQEADLIAALQERIAMQERVINDMGNLLRGMVERFKNLPVPGETTFDRPVIDESLRETVEQQSRTLQIIETYMGTFGQSLREIAEAVRAGQTVGPVKSSRFRSMDAVFLILLVGVVIGFAVVFGGSY
ncbi:MAG: hypothetical protein RLO51_15080 [Thalassobaculum sp.]|uniref:hypothetical protein n=1 Tax=Thalassobaculum sp. TaxID=2022740 RepID=UPI0032EF2BB3